MFFLRNLYNYLKNLPLYIELTVNHKDYVLVHAGIDPENSLEDQEEDNAFMDSRLFLFK